MDQAREHFEAVKALTRRTIDPAAAPYRADPTGTVSSRTAFETCFAIARLFKLDVAPSPGAYLLDGAALDNWGIRIISQGLYCRENEVFTDKSVVLIHGSVDDSMFQPSKGGWALIGVVFYDIFQQGAGATPNLARAPLIQGEPGTSLIDWTIDHCVFVNILDGIRNRPGCITGDYRFTNNRGYLVRTVFWFEEWQPEAGFVHNNIFSPGIFQFKSINFNGAMLKKWSELNARAVYIDMSAAVNTSKTVDGWCSSDNLWFGGWFAACVSGGFNMSSATDIFDNVGTILSITGSGPVPGISFGLNITPKAGYSSNNSDPTFRTRGFHFATTGTYIVTVNGGRFHNFSGDGIIDESTGRGLVTFASDVGTVGSSGLSRSGAVTLVIGAGTVFTRNAHGFIADAPVRLRTTGALPTGLVVETVYYVKLLTVNTFQLSATPGGAAITTSGTQSGIHTIVDAQAAYFLRVNNPNAVYNITCPSLNNFGGHSECIGISVVNAKKVNVKGVSFEGFRFTVVVENTMTGVVNLVGNDDDSQVPGAKSLSVGATAISAGVVKARGNNWKFAYDVDDVIGSI